MLNQSTELQSIPVIRTIQVELEIPTQFVHDAIDGARIGYWGKVQYHGKGKIQVTETDGGADNQTFVLQDGDFAMAIALMAKHAPSHFGYLMSGRSDSATGDLLLQLACFGEEKYA